MKILVRIPNWLGDIIMGTAFINALKKQYPDAQIHIIAKKELAEVVSCIDGVHQVHLFSKKSYRGIRGAIRFGKQLSHFQFDLFFSLPDSFSAALIGYATKAKKRIGFRNEWRSFLLTQAYKKPQGLHRVEEYLHLLAQYTAQKVNTPKVSLTQKLTSRNKQLLLINFNSEASSRRLPLEKAISLSSRIVSEFPNHQIGFIGAPKETSYINSILSSVPNAQGLLNYAGKTSLKELIELLASCSVLLSTDSGPAHVANSVSTPCIVLFGAGNEKNTAPFNKEDLTIVRANRLACEPCVKNTCPLYARPECMNLLDENNIIEALKTILTP